MFQLEGSYRDDQFQLSDHFGANQKLKRVIKGIMICAIPAIADQEQGLALPSPPSQGGAEL